MPTPTSTAHLYGREAETAVLGQILDRACAGHRAMALFAGEAGIGKSRLLDAAVETAAGRGMQIAAGKAAELEQSRPFGLIMAALQCALPSTDRRSAAIAEMLAAQQGGDGGTITVTSDVGLQYRVLDAIVDLVEELALAGPLAICVDDMQWADPASLLTLNAMIHRVAFLPVALIGCRRPTPRAADLDRFVNALEAAGARILTVGPLDRQASRDLAAHTLAAEPGPGLLNQIDKTAGNPLFLTELLAAFLQDGTIHTADGQADMPETGPSPTLRLAILRRLSFLSESTMAALRAASILGSGFTVAQLSITTAQPALDLSLALVNAIAAGVLEEDGRQLRFRHDLIREAIYEDLPQTIRCALHREAGQRLAADGTASVQQVAEQLSRGATLGDGQAIAWLTRAARESGARSPATAADLLHRAVALMDVCDQRRDQRIVEYAQTLVAAGRVAEATATCQELLGRRHDPGAEGPARLCLGRALLSSGRAQEALSELSLAAQAPGLSEVERASVPGWASTCHIWLAQLADAAEAAGKARAAAEATGDHLTAAIATTMFGVVNRLSGNLDESIRLSDQAVRQADQNLAAPLEPGVEVVAPTDRGADRQGHRFPVHAPRGCVLVEMDRLEEARATLDTGTRISQEIGAPWQLASYQMVRTMERFTAGEWDDALAEVEASVELARETGGAYGLAVGHSLESLICLHRNDLARAKTAAAEAVALAAHSAARYDAQQSARARALLLEAEGSLEAYPALTDVWQQCTALGLVLEYRALGPDLVRMALAAADPRQAQVVVAALERLAERNHVSSLTAAAQRCRGLVEDDGELLAAAATRYPPGVRPLERASTCEEAGEVFARSGETARARDLLDQSLEVYRRLGATRDLARAEATLRAAGIRRGRRGARKRPSFGWESLTDTEWIVVDLVAEGLTNPQIGRRLFISPRTVQTHLAHVFGKLDLATRAQLAAAVAAGHSGRDATQAPR